MKEEAGIRELRMNISAELFIDNKNDERRIQEDDFLG